jgi:hypothetical protein
VSSVIGRCAKENAISYARVGKQDICTFFPELSGFVADCRFRLNRWKLRDATRQRVTREEISAAFRSHRKALYRHVTLPETGHRGLRNKQTLKASDIHPGTQISCYFFSTRVYNFQLWTSYRFIRHCILIYLRKCEESSIKIHLLYNRIIGGISNNNT